MELLKRFWKEEEGMGTIELVMIIAALMCVALLFRKQITSFVGNIIDTVMDEELIEAPKVEGEATGS